MMCESTAHSLFPLLASSGLVCDCESRYLSLFLRIIERTDVHFELMKMCDVFDLSSFHFDNRSFGERKSYKPVDGGIDGGQFVSGGAQRRSVD